VNPLKLTSTGKVYSDPIWADPKTPSEPTNFTERVKYLYRVLTGMPHYNIQPAGIVNLLEAGCLMLECEYALLFRVLSLQVAEVVAKVEPKTDAEVFYPGQHVQFTHSLVEDILITGQTRQISSLKTHAGNLAYNDVTVNTHIGTVVMPSTTSSLVVCFFSSKSRDVEFDAEDTEILELLAEGAACMIDLQRAQTQRKLTDQAMFALGSVKTLDEYVQQAKLPEVYGIPSRVMDILQRRIGHESLSIEQVSDEMNLSKRTLQRRLQQQGVSFAELRDQVRYHHSLDYLIKQNLSIDNVSASLDFSDRTSFTNAFKRWTGLSPSTFRRLFRDYV
jgi:AraC-like DNA-binding protein